jgi:hypothetical protein
MIVVRPGQDLDLYLSPSGHVVVRVESLAAAEPFFRFARRHNSEISLQSGQSTQGAVQIAIEYEHEFNDPQELATFMVCVVGLAQGRKFDELAEEIGNSAHVMEPGVTE